MSTHLERLIVAAVVILSAAACSDASPGAPPAPPAPVYQQGSILGTVDAGTNTVTFTPLGLSPNFSGGASPGTYGNQGVTATVFGVVDSVITVAGVSRTWYIRIAMRNLETFSIGSNYLANPAPDTSGVFLFFYSSPVVTLPTGFGYTVAVSNATGSYNFNAPNQQYFWYRSQPTAVQASPGTDTTTNNPEWKFTASSDQVQNFTFVLMVRADWPPPNETAWSGSWVAATDAATDDRAKPPWREYAVAGDATLGIDTIRGSEMVLIAPDSNSSIYMSRHDSMGGMSAVLNVVLRDSTTSSQYQAIFGIVEPAGMPIQGGSGGRQAFVGVAGDRVEFVNFSEGDGTWGNNGSACSSGPCGLTTSVHTYSLRKYARDSVVVCVDGSRKLRRTYNTQLQPTQVSFEAATVVFGVRSSTSTNKTSYWTSANYLIGAGAPGGISGGVCN